MQGIKQHLTYANVMLSIAVFVVLGGGAYADTSDFDFAHNIHINDATGFA